MTWKNLPKICGCFCQPRTYEYQIWFYSLNYKTKFGIHKIAYWHGFFKYLASILQDRSQNSAEATVVRIIIKAAKIVEKNIFRR